MPARFWASSYGSCWCRPWLRGWTNAWEASGSPARQVPFVFRARAVPFAIAAGLASLIPLVNVLLAPALVAGGTLLVRELDQSP